MDTKWTGVVPGSMSHPDQPVWTSTSQYIQRGCNSIEGKRGGVITRIPNLMIDIKFKQSQVFVFKMLQQVCVCVFASVCVCACVCTVMLGAYLGAAV